MKSIDLETLRQFLKLAGERLRGEWVLIGGTVLPLLGVEFRSTTDIDLVGLKPSQQTQTLQLMELAEELGLPVEAINQAGAYFLAKIPSFEDHLVILHHGRSARIYRPDVTLFLRLKIARLSESDLQDCLSFLRLAEKIGESPKRKEISSLLKQELKKYPSSTERGVRLLQLQEELSKKL